MSALSNRSKSNCNSSSSEQNGASKGAAGWNDDGAIFQTQNLDYKLIKVANQKTSLFSLFKRYGLIFEEVRSSSGWTHRGRCPFPAHMDSRPSFGYNSIEDRFNCFGCRRAGQAVEFISFMEHRPKVQVARELLGGTISSEVLSKMEVIEFDRDKLKRLLFDYANCVRAFKREHANSKEAWEYARNVTYGLDVYIQKHAKFNSMVLTDLEVRINKLKEQLKLYDGDI